MYNDCATRMCRGRSMFAMCLYLCMFTVLRVCAGDIKTICVLNHVTILPPSSCFVRNVELFSSQPPFSRLTRGLARKRESDRGNKLY